MKNREMFPEFEDQLAEMDGLATVEEAAKFLALSRSKIYEMMGSGEIVSVRIGRSRRIPRRVLYRIIQDNLVFV